MTDFFIVFLPKFVL